MKIFWLCKESFKRVFLNIFREKRLIATIWGNISLILCDKRKVNYHFIGKKIVKWSLRTIECVLLPNHSAVILIWLLSREISIH